MLGTHITTEIIFFNNKFRPLSTYDLSALNTTSVFAISNFKQIIVNKITGKLITKIIEKHQVIVITEQQHACIN